jgi:hypothetical protein
MPGASWRGTGKPLPERSAGELVTTFVVVPILLAGLILALVVWNVAAHAGSFTAWDWLFQVVWAGCLGLGALLALPAVAWAELRRRKRQRQASAADRGGPSRPDGPPRAAR